MDLKVQIKRMSKIIYLLRTNKSMLFDDIVSALYDDLDKKDFTLRTFQRQLKLIRDIYHIDIKCNGHNEYYIASDIYDVHSALNRRMLEAFDIFNLLNAGEKISNHVIFEKQCSLGTNHLFGLLHAINNKLKVRFHYQPFTEDEPYIRNVEPILLKEFKGRWYLYGYSIEDEFNRIFGLDRVDELEITRTSFIPQVNFKAEKVFEYSYGIIIPYDKETKPIKVVLSFSKLQGKYVKNYPFHESQEILIDTEQEVRISLYLYLTFDFKKELLSYGDNVKVIEPQSLIDDLKTSYFTAAWQY